MTSFEFFRIFLPQTVFIRGWGIKFNFLIFLVLFISYGKKIQIYIQTVKLIFKWLHLNLNGSIKRRQLITPIDSNGGW
jgi:hypothetical protein